MDAAARSVIEAAAVGEAAGMPAAVLLVSKVVVWAELALLCALGLLAEAAS